MVPFLVHKTIFFLDLFCFVFCILSLHYGVLSRIIFGFCFKTRWISIFIFILCFFFLELVPLWTLNLINFISSSSSFCSPKNRFNINYALCWTICGQKRKCCQLNWSFDTRYMFHMSQDNYSDCQFLFCKCTEMAQPSKIRTIRWLLTERMCQKNSN